MPHARFARGPPPVTVLFGKASYKWAATGPGLRPVRQPARRYRKSALVPNGKQVQGHWERLYLSLARTLPEGYHSTVPQAQSGGEEEGSMPFYSARSSVFGLRVPRIAGPLLLFLMAFPIPASAQAPDTVRVPPGISCEDCRILLDSVAFLGDEAGNGFVDETNEVAASSEHFFVVHRVVSSDIRVFNRDGSFLRVLGRKGEGPGEYQNIKALWVSQRDTLHVIDEGLIRRTVVSPDLQVIRTERLPGRVLHHGYLGLKDGTAVLTAVAPDSTGGLRLLHRLSGPGQPLFSFGKPLNASDEINTVPSALVRITAETKSAEIVASHGSSFILEVYGNQGALERILDLSDRDFLELVPGDGRFPGYVPWIQDLWIDEEGKLWVLMRVGDPDWEQGVERVGVGFGRRPSVRMVDYDAFWDTVVEVVDLKAGVTIARRRFEKGLIKFLGRNEVTGWTNLENETFRLPVYRLSLQGLAGG